MDNTKIIKAIIEADKKAKEMVTYAHEQLDSVHTRLADERASMDQAYREKAARHIEDVERSEKEFAQEQITQLDEKMAEDIRMSNEVTEKNRQKWIDELFQMVISAPLED